MSLRKSHRVEGSKARQLATGQDYFLSVEILSPPTPTLPKLPHMHSLKNGLPTGELDKGSKDVSAMGTYWLTAQNSERKIGRWSLL